MDEPKGAFTWDMIKEITQEKGVDEGLKFVVKEIANKDGKGMGDEEVAHFLTFLSEADVDLKKSLGNKEINKEIDVKKVKSLIKNDEVFIQLMFIKNILSFEKLVQKDEEIKEMKAEVEKIELIQEKRMEQFEKFCEENLQKLVKGQKSMKNVLKEMKEKLKASSFRNIKQIEQATRIFKEERIERQKNIDGLNSSIKQIQQQNTPIEEAQKKIKQECDSINESYKKFKHSLKGQKASKKIKDIEEYELAIGIKQNHQIKRLREGDQKMKGKTSKEIWKEDYHTDHFLQNPSAFKKQDMIKFDNKESAEKAINNDLSKEQDAAVNSTTTCTLLELMKNKFKEKSTGRANYDKKEVKEVYNCETFQQIVEKSIEKNPISATYFFEFLVSYLDTIKKIDGKTEKQSFFNKFNQQQLSNIEDPEQLLKIFCYIYTGPQAYKSINLETRERGVFFSPYLVAKLKQGLKALRLKLDGETNEQMPQTLVRALALDPEDFIQQYSIDSGFQEYQSFISTFPETEMKEGELVYKKNDALGFLQRNYNVKSGKQVGLLLTIKPDLQNCNFIYLGWKCLKKYDYYNEREILLLPVFRFKVTGEPKKSTWGTLQYQEVKIEEVQFPTSFYYERFLNYIVKMGKTKYGNQSQQLVKDLQTKGAAEKTKEINISGIDFGDEGASILRKCSLPSVRDICIFKNNLTHKGIQSLTSFILQTKNNLQSIDLSGRKTESEKVIEALKKMQDIFKERKITIQI